MPAQRPRASFEPISPEFDLRELVESTENFQYVDRISCDTIEEQGLENFEKLILLHVVIGGKPLVVDGFEDRLDPWTFTPKWLRDNHGEKVENARNLTARDNLPLTIAHYLNNLGKLTDQYFEKADNFKDKNCQRMYLKDIDCPPVWQEKLKEHIPPSLFYWNDSAGEIGGPGAVDEPIPNGAGRRKGKGIASAGDLMSSLPLEMRAENLMCYIGHEGTYTPAHREMCASLGQNIMVNASESFDENGQPEKPGSSIWFMTESKDRHTVAEYWLSVLGHDIEVESHFAQVAAWQRAPFKVYVVEQKAGDFILIPPLAPHQVWNRGTRTMKVAWNRTTVETLELAMKEALPNARLVCRDEQYKNKAIVYFTLLKYSGLLKSARIQSARSEQDAHAIHGSRKVRQVQKDFKRLFEVYKNILLSESFAPGTKEPCEFYAFDSNVTCAYCRGNIFNRFLSCKTCMDMLNTGTDEPYDVCMDCFAMGRSCACQSKYKWQEQFKWKDLLARYEEWRKQIIEIDGGMTGKTPLSLEQERELYPKKTIAQVCQEQLKKRPWVDIKTTKPPSDEDEEEDIQVNDDGTVKKIIKKRSKAWFENNKTCHVCCGRHPKWMMAICTMCERGWCYGSLWRGHDLMPQNVMEDPNWECPHCRRVCSTGACRKDKRQMPYEPKGTLLGHDTKKVADVRSVEALVDFSVSNLNWIRESVKEGPTESARLQRKRDEAELAKLDDPTLDEHYVDGDEDEGIVLDGPSDMRGQIEYSPVDDIDPALGGGSTLWRPDSQLDDFNGNTMERANDFRSSNNFYHDPSSMNGHEFVAPSALMYQPTNSNSDGMLGGDGLTLSGQATFSRASGKRARPEDGEQIKLVQSKKRKTADEDRPLPKNKASKQYQIAQETKRLEEARKAGRYIQVMAAIRGRKKIVKLKLPSKKAQLAELALKDAKTKARIEDSNQTPGAPNIVLQSDIAPPSGPSAFPSSPNNAKKTGNLVRVRVEDDADFQSSARHGRPKKANQPRYEVFTVGSDEDDEDFEIAGAGVGEASQRRREGRVSSYLARKHQGEEDLPDELPQNFKDGDMNPEKREKERIRREKRKSAPAKPQAAPRIRPIVNRKSTGDMSMDGVSHRPDDQDNGTTPARKRGRPPATTKPSPVQRAIEIAKAAMLEEENRRAKLEAAGLVSDEEEDDTFQSAEEKLPEVKEKGRPASRPTKGGPGDRRPTKGGPADRKSSTNGNLTSAPVRKSMFDLQGKKIKIVGSSSAAVKAPLAKPKSFVEISSDESSTDSSSDADEIPAMIPKSAMRKKGPPGRTRLPGRTG